MFTLNKLLGALSTLVSVCWLLESALVLSFGAWINFSRLISSAFSLSFNSRWSGLGSVIMAFDKFTSVYLS